MTRPSIDFGYPTQADGPLPVFYSIEDEAEYWDTHNVTDLTPLTEADFEDEDRPKGLLSLMLEPTERQELDRRAEAQGMTSARLAGTWLRERLEAERKVG